MLCLINYQSSDEDGDKDKKIPKEDEIIKELKIVKRQNLITHCLVTAMILITLTWQLSEVSLILKIKQGLTNPFKTLCGGIKSFFLRRGQDRSSFKIPDLSYLELPGFEDDQDEDTDHEAS